MTTQGQAYRPSRYAPGYWNGLHGWKSCAQYFNRESGERVTAMMEVSEVLRRHGVAFSVERWKKYYRIMITNRAYKALPKVAKDTIAKINQKYSGNW